MDAFPVRGISGYHPNTVKEAKEIIERDQKNLDLGVNIGQFEK
jgi:hypothetical protein